MHVHMLGWGRDLWEIIRIAEEFPWIRSTDSAKPFVYALKNISLNPSEDIPKYPTRSKTYFKRKLTPEQVKIATNNAIMFRAAAKGMLTVGV
jgi:hypothetical protein